MINFENYLKMGTLLEIEYNDRLNGPIKVKTVIEEDMKNGQLTIAAPMHKGISSPIQVGELMRVYFLAKPGDFEKAEVFAFTGKVRSRLTMDGMPILGVTMTTTPKSFQRRDYFRVSIIKEFELTQSDIFCPILTKDISASGMKFLVRNRLNNEEHCEISFTLEDESFKIDCKIVDQSPIQQTDYSHEVAVKFIDFKDQDRKRLIKILYIMQSDALRKKLRPQQYGNLYEDIYGSYKEKRTFEDRRIRVIRYITAICWFLGFVAFGLINQARPRHSFGIEVFFNEIPGQGWDTVSLTGAFLTSLLLLGLSLSGAYLNSTRLKREGDHFHYSLIILSVLSVTIIGIYSILKMSGL